MVENLIIRLSADSIRRLVDLLDRGEQANGERISDCSTKIKIKRKSRQNSDYGFSCSLSEKT